MTDKTVSVGELDLEHTQQQLLKAEEAITELLERLELRQQVINGQSALISGLRAELQKREESLKTPTPHT
jgi:hypothetical protein